VNSGHVFLFLSLARAYTLARALALARAQKSKNTFSTNLFFNINFLLKFYGCLCKNTILSVNLRWRKSSVDRAWARARARARE
jgi:hypothetical protein